MRPRRLIGAFVALVLAIGVRQAFAAEPDLAAARALYAAASYEEALAKLGLTPAVPTGDSVQVEEYRALCLLALGRAPEAEAALARLVLQQPLYTLDESDDRSPKFAALFHAVRERTLPLAARRIYAAGRERYDAKDFPQAVKLLKDFGSVVADPDAKAKAGELADLKQLAEGFLRLAELEVAASTARAAAEENAREEQRQALRVYTAADPDVTPPAALVQAVPEWRASPTDRERSPLRGVLELLIDDQGRVESASLRVPVSPAYDERLLRAASEWRFTPAKRGERAVRYLRLVEIVLQPQ